MIPTDQILQRTFRIRCGSQTGTCFTVDVEERRYLLTARHIADSIDRSAEVEIAHEGKWKTLSVQLVGHGDGAVDVSVLAPQYLFGGRGPLTLVPPMTLAQDVYFLGFPFGMSTEIGDLNLNFPLPFVKKAILSAFGEDEGLVLLDGHNNPGFSGGPVVAGGSDVDSSDVGVIGVISGYRFDRQAVLDSSKNHGPYTYNMNTGIIHVWSGRQVNKIIQNKPIGIETG